MDLVDLFPKTIGVSTLKTLTPDLIQQAIEYIDHSSQVSLGSDGTYTKEQQLLNHDLFKDVKQEIIDLCKELSQSYDHIVQDIIICNSWANVVHKNESIRLHKHANSYISGSFYLSEGMGFNILNPGHFELFGFLPRLKDDQHPRSWEGFTIDPKPGRIVIFPSGLAHGVVQSQSDQKRYSVAFNTVPLGEIGDSTNLLNVVMT